MNRTRIYFYPLFSIALLAAVIGLWFWADRGGRREPIGEAEAAYDEGDWSGAEARSRAVLKSRPDEARALRVLARSAARQGRGPTAESIYRRLGTGEMVGEDYFLLGRHLLGRGQIGAGLATLGAARDVAPDHAETLNALSKHWADAHSLTDGADAADRLRAVAGWEVRGDVRLARIRSELPEPELAAGLLVDAFKRDPNLIGADLAPAAARRLLVRCWLQSGRPLKAIEAAAGHEGRDDEMAWLTSRAYLQLGNAAAAREASSRSGKQGIADPMRDEPAPFLGAASCAECHAREYETQQRSRHAQTLVPTRELQGLGWPGATVVDTDMPGVTHQFKVTGEAIEAITTVEKESFRAIIAFALGSGHQGRSFLARQPEGQIRELRISHYPSAPEWARTMEHPAVVSDADNYLGRPISGEAFRKCLKCHSTNYRSMLNNRDAPESRDHGIGCERCHGPAGNHVAAIKAKLADPAIMRPRLASSEQVIHLCGECHKASANIKADSPSFVRFQVSTLVTSRCYTESGGGLSCVTCHNPHRNAETSTAYYEAKCLACHPSSAPGVEEDRERKGKTSWRSCPINARGNCIACHMPKVADAIPRSVFTDHEIGIHRGSPSARETRPD